MNDKLINFKNIFSKTTRDYSVILKIAHGLKLIEHAINDYEFRRISKHTLVKLVFSVADDLSLKEFKFYLKNNKDPNPQLLLGLAWHYSDNLHFINENGSYESYAYSQDDTQSFYG